MERLLRPASAAPWRVCEPLHRTESQQLEALVLDASGHDPSDRRAGIGAHSIGWEPTPRARGGRGPAENRGVKRSTEEGTWHESRPNPTSQT